MNMPSSPLLAHSLVPFSPHPCTAVTDHWAPGRAPSCVFCQGGPLAGVLARPAGGRSPRGRSQGWGYGMLLPYTLTSHDAEGPRRSLDPGNMENQGQGPGQPVGGREGRDLRSHSPQAPPASLSQSLKFILGPASSGPSGERQFQIKSEVTKRPPLP